MPAMGSSTSNALGSCMSNMPISSHCFWPCDNSAAGGGGGGGGGEQEDKRKEPRGGARGKSDGEQRRNREQRGPHALVGAHRELEVFIHAVFGKYRGFLKFAADARARDLVLAHARQIHLRAEKGRALIGTRLSGNHVHHRGLARTVGADDAAQFAVVDIKRELIKRLEAVKAHRDVLKIQYGCAARVHRARSTAGSYVGYFVKSFFTPFEQRPHLATSLSAGRRRRRHRPTKPRGRNNVATMNRAPSANNHTSGNAPVK